MVMCGIGSATKKEHRCADAWRRHLSIVLDGLRAGGGDRAAAALSALRTLGA